MLCFFFLPVLLSVFGLFCVFLGFAATVAVGAFYGFCEFVLPSCNLSFWDVTTSVRRKGFFFGARLTLQIPDFLCEMVCFSILNWKSYLDGYFGRNCRLGVQWAYWTMFFFFFAGIFWRFFGDLGFHFFTDEFSLGRYYCCCWGVLWVLLRCAT